MIRIAGRNIDPKKQARFALTPIKGVGLKNIKDILKALEIDPISPLSNLSEEELTKLRNYVEDNYTIEGDLTRLVQSNIRRLVELKTWRGARHKAGLPTRGQTTRTNSRTRRGNKHSTGVSGKPKSASKT